MSAKVICISRATFTQAEDIAAEVAGELGFRYVDEEIVERAAQRQNLIAAEVVATADEGNVVIVAGALRHHPFHGCIGAGGDQGADLAGGQVDRLTASRTVAPPTAGPRSCRPAACLGQAPGP